MKDQKLDALLRGWEVQPPPSLVGQGDGAWDERAASIVQNAVETARAHAPLDDSFLRAPALESEPGEPAMDVHGAGPASFGVKSGDKKMSDDRDPPPSAARPSSRAGRPSLKELAERVSKTPPPPSIRPSEMAAPTTKVSPPPSSAERISSLPERVSSVPASIRPPVAPISITHVESAPSIAKTAPVIAEVAAPVSSAAPAVPANDVPAKVVSARPADEKKGSNGLIIGIGAGVVALAAAAAVFFYVNNKKPQDANTAAKSDRPTTEATAQSTAVEKPAAPKDEETPQVAKQDEPERPGGVDLDSIGDASDSAAPLLTGRLPVGSSSPIATNDEPKDETKDGPHRVEPNGTLDEAMRDAAGPADEHKGQEPASTPTGPKNLPDTPPNGSVSAAIGSVRGAARSCVAGADKDSSATIVFGSNGSVQSVSVGGWAAGKPAAGCIQGAVSGAHVEPFTKPSFPVTMTIRP